MVSALVIVAHPDDETIWMGGTILKNKDLDWTILSLCRKDDADRAPKFKKVCQYYNARPIISDLDDKKLKPLSEKEVIKKIKSNLPRKTYDYIFTHGENGEYGHIRHKEIHKAVKKMIKNKDLVPKEFFCFAYLYGTKSTPGIPNLKLPEINQEADLIIELNNELHLNKVKIVTDIYGFSKESFEALSCNKKEAFTREK